MFIVFIILLIIIMFIIFIMFIIIIFVIVQEPKWESGKVWEYKVLWLILNLYVYWRKFSLVALTINFGNFFIRIVAN